MLYFNTIRELAQKIAMCYFIIIQDKMALVKYLKCLTSKIEPIYTTRTAEATATLKNTEEDI